MTMQIIVKNHCLKQSAPAALHAGALENLLGRFFLDFIKAGAFDFAPCSVS